MNHIGESRRRFVLWWTDLAAAAIVILVAAGAARADLGLGVRGAWVDNRNTDDHTSMKGAFLRMGPPLLQAEAGVDYRSEDLGGGLTVKTWPVTLGAVLSPLPWLYGVAGVGWYHTTADFPAYSSIEDHTATKFGYHAGAGVRLPVVPSLSVVVDGRYTYIDYKLDEFADALGDFKKGDYFTVNAGLMFEFPMTPKESP
ncbi:MAG: outer membrane beta-barrel protein [bacterium]